MAIAPLPDPPTRDDPANFATRADAFLAALVPFAAQAEAMRVEVETDATAAQLAALSTADDVTDADAARVLAQAAAASAIAAPASPSTSTTSLAVTAGTKAITTQSGKLWAAGQWVTVARTSDPTVTSMTGQVVSYSGTALSVSVLAAGLKGSGTFTDWTITGASAPTDQTAKLDKANGVSQGGYMTHVALGAIASGGTATVNFNAGEMFDITAPASGSMTLAVSNVPNTAGVAGIRMLQLTNFGGKTVTWPAGNWIKADNTEVATPALAGVSFLASGANRVFVFFGGNNTLKFKAM